MATQCNPNTMASHTPGDRVGSANSSVMARATERRTAPPRAGFGRNQASGRTHAAYHGSSTGDTNTELRLAHPMAPITTTGPRVSG